MRLNQQLAQPSRGEKIERQLVEAVNNLKTAGNRDHEIIRKPKALAQVKEMD